MSKQQVEQMQQNIIEQRKQLDSLQKRLDELRQQQPVNGWRCGPTTRRYLRH
jgi:SMC interacting uncharacterized protein involved in chromosome segregation